MTNFPVLLAGQWREAEATGSFQAMDPSTGKPIEGDYPVSSRADLEAAVEAAAGAADALLDFEVGARATFLEAYADRIDANADEIAEMASRETGLPLSPRLRDVELPRTTGQLRQAAAAAREGTWMEATIDTETNIRSRLGPLGGAVAIFGPNNFPLAFNGISGGDFAAAIAAGNPVIAKAHSSHPGTSRLLAEQAHAALEDAGLPPATVQMLYRLSHEDGELLVSHPAIGATGYTGARSSGLTLKAAADKAGKPIYLELSSINPIFILPRALESRGEELVGEYVTSVLMGAGQFCTNPGITVVVASESSRQFISGATAGFEETAPGCLLGERVVSGLGESVEALVACGAELLTGGAPADGAGFRFQNTLLQVSGESFLLQPEALQREAFGNAGLIVEAADEAELVEISKVFEGNLTGSIYSCAEGGDDALYASISRNLRRRVGRLLNDKMPTGVAVSSAMNHGGPFPATGHPGFTAVGIPGSIRRFAALECYDNVRADRLPVELGDRNPWAGLYRLVDGRWSGEDVS